MSERRKHGVGVVGDLGIPPGVSAGTVKHLPEWKWMDSVHPLDRERMNLPYPRQYLTDGMIEQFMLDQSSFKAIRIVLRIVFTSAVVLLFAAAVFIAGCAGIIPLLIGGLLWFLTANALREQRLRAAHRRIVAQRLCLSGGYSMVAQQINDEHIGVCSECGTPFDIRLYCPKTCPKCRYDLTGITPGQVGRAKCPECGAACDVVPVDAPSSDDSD